MPQTTFLMIKPDAVQRGLMGRVISRLEDKGLRVVAMKFMMVPRELAETHYAEHREKPFFQNLIKFITSAPVMAMAVAGPEAISVARKLIGATNGIKAEPGTIRGDFGLSGSLNLVHGSDSPESAERELALWFKKDELLDYTRDVDRWVREL